MPLPTFQEIGYTFLKSTQYQRLVKMWRNWKPHTLLVGMHNGAATLENNLAVS